VRRIPRFAVLFAGFAALLCGAAASGARLAEPAGAFNAVPLTEGRAACEVRAMSATLAVEPGFVSAFAEAAERNEVRRVARLIPAGKPLDDRAETEILAKVREHVGRYENLAGLAKALELKPLHAEVFLREPSKWAAASRATLIRRAGEWCQADARQRELQAAGYVGTAVTRLVVSLAAAARDTHTIGLVTGGAGLGKTAALAAVAAQLPGCTIIVRADPRSRGARGILSAIGGAAASSNGRGAEPTVKRGIDAVRSSNGLLIVDEAHLLSVSAMEAVRAIFDQSECGVVLIGTSALSRTLRGDADPLVGPLVSRIALRVELDVELLTPGPTGRMQPWVDAETVAAIVGQRVGADLSAEALASLVEVANRADGHLRTAVNLAKLAAYIARRGGAEESPAVTAEHLGTARRLGGQTA
jgi:hypothetical protein